MPHEHADFEDLLNRIRRREYVSPLECQTVFRQDAADEFRKLLTDGDLETALSLLDSARHDDVFRLGIHMLQALQLYSRDEALRIRVRGILEGLWLSVRHSAVRGTSLCFALLNEKDLTDEWRSRLFDFYLETWNYQIDNQRSWADGAQRVVEKIKQRLADSRFPLSKRWIYVLALGASDDHGAVRRLLDTLDTGRDPLERRAVEEVRKRLSLQ